MVAYVGPLILIVQSGLLNPGYGCVCVCVQFVLSPHLRQFKESILPLAGWKKHEPARAAFVTVKHPRSAVLRFSKEKKEKSPNQNAPFSNGLY